MGQKASLDLRPYFHLVNPLALHRWNFNVERQSTLVPQNSKLRGFSFPSRGQLRAQFRDVADPLAVQRSNHISGLHADLFRSRTGDDVAHQNAFAVWRSEIGTQLAANVFRVDTQPRATR